jgi:hypothetical protein
MTDVPETNWGAIATAYRHGGPAAAVHELNHQGYAIVPKEPNERMIREGARELVTQGLCEVEVSDSYACFKAMISAAPKVTE